MSPIQFDVTAFLAKQKQPKSLEIKHQPNNRLSYCTSYLGNPNGKIKGR